ncbi:glycosyltransferase [Aliivibrio sp. S3MY1]|uniref:glycosyltransferase n=1 Tax=unclassified Aliivibrio TaxID=2645654 RepID=UPI002379F371|nr:MULTISPECIES: glycosyltransferase [unclassified Aliivibrio]MDD9196708.1 glycosyltransferase [Aliivibrio sp. S3MY1]MDD9199801.1 glycosyltransferase [Aliivibrio sp. S2MY1]
MSLAPIILFVYNRPDHTKKTIQALQQNVLASESELFIYADAAKNESAQQQVDEVCNLISDVSGFKKITVIKQETNVGLANSIISGVTEIVNKYGKVIVLEDDLVTSPYFLTFMNDALDLYSNKKDIWHISGWNYPIETDGIADTFLWRTMNCWGWATWDDRWQHFEKNTDKLMESFTAEKIKAFNLDGYENFWGQVLANKEGKINTWAIYWYASIFEKNGLCLNPTETFVDNIGLDGSGIHCGVNTSYIANLNINNNITFETNLEESSIALERIQLFYRKMEKSFLVRAINKLSRVLIKKNIVI